MPFNPRDYDPSELANLAREHDIPIDGVDTDDPSSATPAGRSEEALRSNQYRELLLLEGIARDRELSKPYLDTLPQTFTAELIAFEWLEALLEKGGFRRTLDAIAYYESVGWLSEDVGNRLQDYLRALDEPASETTADLDRSDHLMSLIYAARLSLLVE